MQKSNHPDKKPMDSRLKPGLTPEADERGAISLATDLAKKQLENGTASSQTINYFLRRGGRKEQLECQLLEKQIELAVAKAEQLKASSRLETLYTEAINAMKSYGSHINDKEDDDQFNLGG